MSSADTADPSPAPWPAPEPAAPPAGAASDIPNSEGPLRSLAHKAAATGLVRRARQGVPSFAEPAVSRTASTADAVLSHVDTGLTAAQRTLDTDEGKALRSAAAQLFHALYVFVAMLAIAALEHAEKALDVRYDDDTEPPKPHTRVVKVVKVAGSKVKDRFEKRERQVAGTREAEIYKKARWVGGVGVAVVTCVTSALTKYNGPAKEYVVPVAERAMSVLPETGSEHSEPGAPAEETSTPN